MKTNCEVCFMEIDVDERALKLCFDCSSEKCRGCGHSRWNHVDNDGSCIFEYSLGHKDPVKRGEFCPCERFRESK